MANIKDISKWGFETKQLHIEKIKPNTIRLSMGTESAKDIIADLEQAFEA